MASTKVFYDENKNELHCFMNDKGDLYIGAGDKEDDYFFGHVVLKREDVKELIAELQKIEPFINEE